MDQAVMGVDTPACCRSVTDAVVAAAVGRLRVEHAAMNVCGLASFPIASLPAAAEEG